MISLLLALHLLAAMIWIGGMLAMLLVVRPTAVDLLEPPLRLRFMHDALGRFFPWVLVAVVILPLTGYGLLPQLYGGMGSAPMHVHIMQGIGWPMILIFLWVRFVAWRRMGQALVAGEPPLAASALETVRRAVVINSLLGVVLVAVASGGRYWG